MGTTGVAGIILAGGVSRRLGRDKAVEPFEGEPLIHRVLGRVAEVVDESIVVVNTDQRARELPLPAHVTAVTDVYPDTGSLGGIFSGLNAASSYWGLVVACDMPFLNLGLIRHMLTLRDDRDAVVPMVEGRPEPTHALYSKDCLPHIERRLKAGEFKIAGFFDDVRVEYVSEEVIDEYDDEHLSFFNVNTPEDLSRALQLAASDQG